MYSHMQIDTYVCVHSHRYIYMYTVMTPPGSVARLGVEGRSQSSWHPGTVVHVVCLRGIPTRLRPVWEMSDLCM